MYHYIPLDKYNRKCVVRFSSLPKELATLIKNIYDGFFVNHTPDINKFESLILDIAKTSPVEPIELVHWDDGEVIETLYTPEEKLIGSDVLKALIELCTLYDTWRKKVKVLKDLNYSEDDIKTILKAIE